MNNIVAFNNRRYGFAPWTNYDSILSRLCVTEADAWCGITPSTEASDYNPEPPIFAAKFATVNGFQNILAIANEDGMVAFHDTEVGAMRDLPNDKPLSGFQCHHNAVFDLAWMPHQTQLVSASGDHSARLWGLTESSLVLIRSFHGHTRSLKTVAFRHDDPAVFATGGRDGAILMWDIRANSTVILNPKPDNIIRYCHGSTGVVTPSSNSKKKIKQTPNQSSSRNISIIGLVFQDEYNLISCGAGDGVIKVWDFRKNYSISKREPLAKYILPYVGTSACKGFTNLIVDKNRTKLYANCMDNNIYCYNISSYSEKPIQKYVGLQNGTFYIKSSLSPDGQYLVSGSTNEKAYIWNTKYSHPLLSLEGHEAEVTCAEWCPNNEVKIVTCSDDAKHHVWRIGSEFLEENERTALRGRSELIEGYRESVRNINKCLKLNEALETTPRAVRKWAQRNERTPSSDNKLKTICEMCKNMTPTYNTIACDTCQNTTISSSRSSKRSLSKMLGSNCSSLSTTEETGISEPKRIHLENKGARRLFSPPPSLISNTTRGLTNSNEDTHLATILEETEDCNNSILVNNSRVISKNHSPVPVSPESNSHNINDVFANTPHSVKPSNFSSPTVNLPNFVIDGEAPHLRTISPKKKLKESVDWLTKIRHQKAFKTEPQNVSNLGHSSPKLVQSNCLERSPDTHGTPSRRVRRSRSSTDQMQRTPVSKRSNPEGTLLRFFTVTRTNNLC